MAEAVKKEEVKSKGPIGKLKELSEDKEEQMAILSTFVRLGILIWAGGILTINYVDVPGLSKQEKIDPGVLEFLFIGFDDPIVELLPCFLSDCLIQAENTVMKSTRCFE